ncbi:hypothetical protein ABIE69_003144 [Rhodobacteraceae bacterium MBR-64]
MMERSRGNLSDTMKIHWSHIILPLAAATVSGWLGSAAVWEGVKAPLLTFLSVIAAGVLVRLARGMPFTNTSGFDLDFARKVASAVKTSIRALRTLLIIIFITMGMVTFSSILGKATVLGLITIGLDGRYSDPIISALIGGLLCYVFVRIFAVVSGDVSLADMQADMVVTAAKKTQTEHFSATVEAATTKPISNPAGYGKVVQ